MTIQYSWRGDFASGEVNALHALAFATRVYGDDEWDWRALVHRHSLGWVTARTDDAVARLVGFVNVPWDGLVHAWIQDTMVAPEYLHQGIGKRLVAIVGEHAREAGCEWLHVDFDDELRRFYIDACGFAETRAGTKRLVTSPSGRPASSRRG